MIELQGDLLRQATLVELQFRPDDDNRSRGVVHAFTQQILTEASLLALNHVGHRLERAIAGTEDRAAAAAVVEQRIDRLL